MPNWVFNTLTIEGNPELVKELKKQVSEPYVMPVESNGDLAFTVNDQKVESEFSFWNIIRPTNMEAYLLQPARSELDVNDPNWWADTMRVSSTDDSWYNWNNRNWGCKWDASDVALVADEPNGENHVLVYKFDTPWSPAMPAMLKLSEQYPTLLLTLEYEEEQGWGGEIEMHHGKISAESSYDDKCWECDEINNLDYCEECDSNVCLACKSNREGDTCGHELQTIHN